VSAREREREREKVRVKERERTRARAEGHSESARESAKETKFREKQLYGWCQVGEVSTREKEKGTGR